MFMYTIYHITYHQYDLNIIQGRLPAPALRLRGLPGQAGTLPELRDPPQGPGGRHLRRVWVAAAGGLPSSPPPSSDHSLL